MTLKSLFTDEAMYSPRAQILNQVLAIALGIFFVTALTLSVGVPPTLIVGLSATVGFFCWRATNLRKPIAPLKTAIVFLLTTAMLHLHMIEEHGCLFGPAMSRLFGIAFPEDRFLKVFVFILPTIYYFTAVGLLLRVPLAAFIAWFIFIGPGLAEVTHFVFPFIAPALEPANPQRITAVIHGVTIADMPNHYLGVTGKYYFPGMVTAILPMIPGSYAVGWLMKNRRAAPGVGSEG